MHKLSDNNQKTKTKKIKKFAINALNGLLNGALEGFTKSLEKAERNADNVLKNKDKYTAEQIKKVNEFNKSKKASGKVLHIIEYAKSEVEDLKDNIKNE